MTNKRKKIVRALSSKLGVTHQGALNILRKDGAIARTRESSQHPQSSVELAAGTVTEALADVSQVDKIDTNGLLRLWDTYHQADDPKDHRTMALPAGISNIQRFRVRAVLDEFDEQASYEEYCTGKGSISVRLIQRTVRELNRILGEAAEAAQ